jgi:hypothetical protein
MNTEAFLWFDEMASGKQFHVQGARNIQPQGKIFRHEQENKFAFRRTQGTAPPENDNYFLNRGNYFFEFDNNFFDFGIKPMKMTQTFLTVTTTFLTVATTFLTVTLNLWK